MLNQTQLVAACAAIAKAAKDSAAERANAQGDASTAVQLVRDLAVQLAETPAKVKAAAAYLRVAMIEQNGVPKGTADPMVSALQGYVVAITEGESIATGFGTKGDTAMPANIARTFNRSKIERDNRAAVASLISECTAAIGRAKPLSFTDAEGVAKSIETLTKVRDELVRNFPAVGADVGHVVTKPGEQTAEQKAAAALAAFEMDEDEAQAA